MGKGKGHMMPGMPMMEMENGGKKKGGKKGKGTKKRGR